MSRRTRWSAYVAENPWGLGFLVVSSVLWVGWLLAFDPTPLWAMVPIPLARLGHAAAGHLDERVHPSSDR